MAPVHERSCHAASAAACSLTRLHDRNHGYGAEAIVIQLGMAADHGLSQIADTTPTTIASQ
jgi:hypothetical protein